MKRRNARWLRSKITGLFTTDSRTARRYGYVLPLNARHWGGNR